MDSKYYLITWILSLILLLASPQLSNSQESQKDSSYKIVPGDVLDITTWKEPDFSVEEVLVRSDGMVTFPLLNDIQAAGRTTIELKEDIENRLKEYVGNPVVTVSLRTPIVEVEKFYILGEVVNTGEYELAKDLTVLQAFALAGGFTEWASKKEIIVLRKENGKEKEIIVNYKNIVKGKDLSQNIKIQANDTIIVP
jgi:polysaccharide export outer membrane protein